MVEYTCPKCGKEFKQKGHYTRHINKKNPCISQKKLEEYNKSLKIDKRLTVCDLFCGAGGFSEGFHQSGYNVIFSLDNWDTAIKTHDLNHPNCKAIVKDILELDTPEKIDEFIPDSDVIIGSPPCISFSTSNKAGKADKTLGIKLINQFLKIILWKINKGVCKYWIMENVPNSIKYIKDEYTWNELGLPGTGPNLKVPVKQKLIASNYGAPQDRQRAICGNYPLPVILDKKNHIKDVFDMLGSPLEKKDKYTDILYNIEHTIITDHLYDTEIPKHEWEKAKRLKIDHGFMGKMCFPDNINRPSRTVMATMSCSTRESIIFQKENTDTYRTPTIREIACFMGFPINYQFYGKSDTIKHKQIGNAVCPPIAKALGIAILNMENIMIKSPITRVIADSNYNLNGRKLKVKTESIKCIHSKFNIHVPYLKINQFRAELTNSNSNIFNYKTKEEMMKELKYKDNKITKNDISMKLIDTIDTPIQWDVYIHRGSGKNATKCHINHSQLTKYIVNVKKIKKEIKHMKITNPILFQKSYCGIIKDHISPMELLTNVSTILDKYCDDKLIHISECKELFKTDSDNKIPIKIITANWILSYLLS